MKARKSELARRLLADPVARGQLRAFMAGRKAVVISVPIAGKQLLVVPTLISTRA